MTRVDHHSCRLLQRVNSVQLHRIAAASSPEAFFGNLFYFLFGGPGPWGVGRQRRALRVVFVNVLKSTLLPITALIQFLGGPDRAVSRKIDYLGSKKIINDTGLGAKNISISCGQVRELNQV